MKGDAEESVNSEKKESKKTVERNRKEEEEDGGRQKGRCDWQKWHHNVAKRAEHLLHSYYWQLVLNKYTVMRNSFEIL